MRYPILKLINSPICYTNPYLKATRKRAKGNDHCTGKGRKEKAGNNTEISDREYWNKLLTSGEKNI